MKKTLLTILAITLHTVWAVANDKYTQAMEAALSQLRAATNVEQMQAAANRFEMIGKNAAGEWLPNYYAAYGYVTMSYMEKDSRKRDRYVEKAENLLAALPVENDEIHVLRAYVAQANLAIDGQSRWQTQGKIFEENLEKAEKLNPENPRIDYLRGVNLLYTPEPFGGGSKNACPLLQRAKAKFDAFKPASSLAPNWGADWLGKYLARCK